MPNIGIDFGTTNSVIVAYNKKKNEFTYFNFARGRGGAPIPTSSTVWYHDNLVEVGKMPEITSTSMEMSKGITSNAPSN